MLPPGLSMLWEPVEAETALAERFGFLSLLAASEWVAGQLERTWAVDVRGCTRLVISDQNAIAWVDGDRGPLVVKWSRDVRRFEHLAATTGLLRALAERGVPVAAPVATPDGRVRVVLDGPAGPLSTTVLPELAGEWLDVRDDAAVLDAGRCLARLHRALAPLDDAVPGPPPQGELAQRVARWLRDEDHGLAPVASRRLEQLLAAAPALDEPLQLVHHDFRAANVLTRGSRVVGVLDLDDVVLGHRVADLAKASVYLATRFTAWQPTPRAVRELLRAGYESVATLGPAERTWLELLVVWHGLMAVPGEHDPAGWAAAV